MMPEMDGFTLAKKIRKIDKDIPILFDFPAGHEPDNRAMIFGRTVNLSISKGTNPSKIEFDE